MAASVPMTQSKIQWWELEEDDREDLDFLLPPRQVIGLVDEVPVDHWNEVEDEYAFFYANPEKKLKKMLVKCLTMNDKLLVDALSEGSSDPIHLEISVADYIGENGNNNYSDQFKNIGKFVNSLDVEVLFKLDSSSISDSSSNPRRGVEGKGLMNITIYEIFVLALAACVLSIYTQFI